MTVKLLFRNNCTSVNFFKNRIKNTIVSTLLLLPFSGHLHDIRQCKQSVAIVDARRFPTERTKLCLHSGFYIISSVISPNASKYKTKLDKKNSIQQNRGKNILEKKNAMDYSSSTFHCGGNLRFLVVIFVFLVHISLRSSLLAILSSYFKIIKQATTGLPFRCHELTIKKKHDL